MDTEDVPVKQIMSWLAILSQKVKMILPNIKKT